MIAANYATTSLRAALRSVGVATEAMLANFDGAEAANALSAEARAGQIPTPSLEMLRAKIASQPPTTIVSTPARRCRIFALSDVRADYPWNCGEALTAALRADSIGEGDVCVCV